MEDKIKKLMKLHNITYVDMGKRLNRSPYTVKQRLNTSHTFHKYEDEYMEALNECIEHKRNEIDKILREIDNNGN